MKIRKEVCLVFVIFYVLFFHINFSSAYDYGLDILPNKDNKPVFSELDYFGDRTDELYFKGDTLPKDVSEILSGDIQYLSDKEDSVLENNSDFSMGVLDNELIRIKLKQGENKRKTIGIKNYLDEPMQINISTTFNDFVLFSDRFFVLQAGDIKLLDIDFYSKYITVPDSYVGAIYIKSNNYTKKINVIIDILEKEPLFDVITDVEKKDFYPGDSVNANMTVINMGDRMDIDILLDYSIKDFENETIVTYKKESLAIDKNLSVKRYLDIPKDIEPGKYVFQAKSSYKDVTATGADVFEVKEREFFSEGDVYLIAKIMLILFFGLISYFIILKILSFFRNRKSFVKSKNKAKKKNNKTKKDKKKKIKEKSKEKKYKKKSFLRRLFSRKSKSRKNKKKFRLSFREKILMMLRKEIGRV